VSKTKINIKKIVATLLWMAIGVSGIVLLVAAVKSKNEKTCNDVVIEIIGVSNNFFIDKSDVLRIIRNFVGGNAQGRSIRTFNLAAIESHLEKEVWIKNAELFFDNNEVLRVSIDEREPVARVFTFSGNSFYVDSSLKVLPLSDKFSARLPVFTGFNHDPAFLSKADSSLLASIKEISMTLQADSFLMAMIEQVDITPQRSFEMIPKIGNQLIVFGEADDVAEKFKKLKMFYKAVITHTGWSKYSMINLQYKNQVVAKIKDAADKTSDSLKAFQIMQLIAARAARQAADSVQFPAPDNDRSTTDSSMIQQSVQREEEEQTINNVQMPTEKKPAAIENDLTAAKNTTSQKKPALVKINSPAPKKITPPKAPAQKPKAVMNR
jgi:cell division protein FtsQ